MLSTLVRILRKAGFAVKVCHLTDSKNRKAKIRFCEDYKKEIENKTLLKQTVPADK